MPARLLSRGSSMTAAPLARRTWRVAELVGCSAMPPEAWLARDCWRGWPCRPATIPSFGSSSAMPARAAARPRSEQSPSMTGAGARVLRTGRSSWSWSAGMSLTCCRFVRPPRRRNGSGGTLRSRSSAATDAGSTLKEFARARCRRGKSPTASICFKTCGIASSAK